MVNIVSSDGALWAERGKMNSALRSLTIGNVSQLFPFPSLLVLMGVLVNLHSASGFAAELPVFILISIDYVVQSGPSLKGTGP